MNRVALVTGAAKRLGASISCHLAEEGWSLVLHYHRSRKEAEELACQLKEHFPGQDFWTLKCDLSDTQEVVGLLDQRSIKGIEIQALVNNASVFVPGSLEDLSSDFLKEQMDVNFVAPLFLMQAFKKRYPSGSVVNLLDTNIVNNEDTHAAYLLAKKGLEAVTQMAALAWAPSFRVNGVAPGPVLPPPGKGDDHLARVVAKTPLRRQVDTQEIARTVSFLLNNSSITGQVIFCDGGAHLV